MTHDQLALLFLALVLLFISAALLNFRVSTSRGPDDNCLVERTAYVAGGVSLVGAIALLVFVLLRWGG